MLHVCVSATLYRPLDANISVDSAKSSKTDTSCSSTQTTITNSTFLGTTNNDAKRYIEHLFMEESKNRLNDYYNTNKLGKIGCK